MSLQFVEPSVPNFFQTPSFNQLFLTKVKPIDSSNCNLWADKTGLCNSVLNSGCLIAVGVITVVDCYRSCWWPILLPVSVGPFNRVSGARQQLSISWIESAAADSSCSLFVHCLDFLWVVSPFRGEGANWFGKCHSSCQASWQICQLIWKRTGLGEQPQFEWLSQCKHV